MLYSPPPKKINVEKSVIQYFHDNTSIFHLAELVQMADLYYTTCCIDYSHACSVICV